MVKMPIIQENKPFKDHEDAKAEIRNCDLFGGICQYACFAFAALGVYGDALNVTLGLEPTSWFLLAFVAGLFRKCNPSFSILFVVLDLLNKQSKTS